MKYNITEKIKKSENATWMATQKRCHYLENVLQEVFEDKNM